MPNKICAGIITFNPEIVRLDENISRLEPQVSFVYIVDNGSNNIEKIRHSFKSSCKIIELGENKGIAAALNVLMKAAEEDGFSWVLSMDQDTRADTNLIAEYIKFLDMPNVGALCPGIKKVGEQAQINGESEVEIVHRCPTSGFFCNVEAFLETDGYDDWMFIDYVDYDLCMKIELAGYKIYRINTTYIVQELGKMHTNKLFYSLGKLTGMKRLMNFARTYNHSAFRNYYYVRNSLYFINKYKKHLNTKIEYNRVLKWEIKKIILEPEKIKKIQSIMKGYIDYRREVK